MAMVCIGTVKKYETNHIEFSKRVASFDIKFNTSTSLVEFELKTVSFINFENQIISLFNRVCEDWLENKITFL